MKKISRLDYAYAVGRIRALENNLISRDVFLEAAGEKEINNALKTIYDAGSFLDEMNEVTDSSGLDRFILNEKIYLNKQARELLPDDSFEKIFQEENNLNQVLFAAKAAGFSFIIDYFRHKIDLINIKLFCRVKYMEYPLQKLRDFLIPGGFLEEVIFIRNFELKYTEMSDKLYASPYQKLWDNAIDKLNEEDTLIFLERGIEDFLMQYLRKAKYIVFGPEPVFAYIQARRMELQLVRLVCSGLMNKIPPQIIKMRISETYV